MDPNEALENLRTFIGLVLDVGRYTAETVEAGAEAAQALDTWMSNGGFLPQEWARAKGPL